MNTRRINNFDKAFRIYVISVKTTESVAWLKPAQSKQGRVKVFFFLQKTFSGPPNEDGCHLKNLSMVLRGLRPLAFLEGGEEGESRLNHKINTNKKVTFFCSFNIIIGHTSLPSGHVIKQSHLLVLPLPACVRKRWTLSANRNSHIVNIEEKPTPLFLLWGPKKKIYWGKTQLQDLFGDIKSAISGAGLFRKRPGCSSLEEMNRWESDLAISKTRAKEASWAEMRCLFSVGIDTNSSHKVAVSK